MIEESCLPEAEADKYLNRLEGLGYVKRGPKSTGLDYILINITKEGLKTAISLKTDHNCK